MPHRWTTRLTIRMIVGLAHGVMGVLALVSIGICRMAETLAEWIDPAQAKRAVADFLPDVEIECPNCQHRFGPMEQLEAEDA